MSAIDRAEELMVRWFGEQWMEDMKNVNLWSAIVNAIAAAERETEERVRQEQTVSKRTTKVDEIADDVEESLEGWKCSAGFAPRSDRRERKG